MTEQNPLESFRLWRVQRPDAPPHLRSDLELFELADRESNIMGNPSFRGKTTFAARSYLKRLGFSVELI